MTEVVYSPKIKPEHLARKAIVYLRQSSDKQVTTEYGKSTPPVCGGRTGARSGLEAGRDHQ